MAASPLVAAILPTTRFHYRIPQIVRTRLGHQHRNLSKCSSKNIQTLYPIVNHFIIDIKDINNEVYQQYTGRSNEQMIENLRWLVNQGAANHITVRIPHIPGM